MRVVLTACRGYFVAAALFSLAINLLYLAAPIYMLQVYDRVISSGSVPTLAMLTVALLIAFVALAGLDVVRSRVMARAGIRLDTLLAGRVVAASVARMGEGGARSQPLRDFDTFRTYLTGNGMNAVFDLPWAPIYIGVIYLLHPALGLFALVSAAVLAVMAFVNEWLVRTPLKEANETVQRNYSFTEASLRNAEVVKALGMADALIRRWSRDRNRVLDRQTAASDRASAISGAIRFLRMSMQSVILGLGAYLVLQGSTTVGAMFAASILLGRALQPVELMVGQWRAMVGARAAYGRVGNLLAANPPPDPGIVLPRPAGRLSVEAVNYALPGTSKLILREVSFRLEPGEALGIIGPSGAGKSTLARHLVGVLAPTTGAVRLDGADVSRRAYEVLGGHLGYLPQDVELFADTVAANISRFQAGADAGVVQAAQRAGVHDMILRLADGYDTEIGEAGAVLSGGYRQRIALARAVFGNPSLVVLDEPSSNLDSDGDTALNECVLQLKAAGVTVVIVSHRPATLATVDRILVLTDGAVQAFGERNEVLARLTRSVAVKAVPDASRGAAAAGA
jgi:PrtD family type I secretion system ABC transporter